MPATTNAASAPSEPKQHEIAFALANKVRHERSEIKRQLRAGDLKIVDLIAEPPAVLRKAKVAAFLLEVPGIGETTRDRLLRAIRASHAVTFAALTDRQRELLSREITAHEHGHALRARLREQMNVHKPLTSVQECVLHLADTWGAVTAEQVVTTIGITLQVASRSVAALQRRGYLDADNTPTPDGRAYLQTISAAA